MTTYTVHYRLVRHLRVDIRVLHDESPDEVAQRLASQCFAGGRIESGKFHDAPDEVTIIAVEPK